MLTIILVVGYIVVISAGICGIAVFLNDLVANWSHAKAVIELPAPQIPNYWHIAQLERELFGRTFHNPDPEPGPCRCDECRFKSYPVKPPPPGLDASWQDRYGE